jgi:hypothetical protein
VRGQEGPVGSIPRRQAIGQRMRHYSEGREIHETQSNINHNSALAAKKGKEKGPQANKGQQDSGKTGRNGGVVGGTRQITSRGMRTLRASSKETTRPQRETVKTLLL